MNSHLFAGFHCNPGVKVPSTFHAAAQLLCPALLKQGEELSELFKHPKLLLHFGESRRNMMTCTSELSVSEMDQKQT